MTIFFKAIALHWLIAVMNLEKYHLNLNATDYSQCNVRFTSQLL